jgi:hypothetical protein
MWDTLDTIKDHLKNIKNKKVKIGELRHAWVTKPERAAIEHVCGSMDKFVEFMEEVDNFEFNALISIDSGAMCSLQHDIYYHTEMRKHVASKGSAFSELQKHIAGDLPKSIQSVEKAIVTVQGLMAQMVRYLDDIQKLSGQKDSDIQKYLANDIKSAKENIEKAQKAITEGKQILANN